MHRKGLDGRPQKNLTFLTSESGSPKKWFAIAHKNHRNEGCARFGARLTFKRVGRAVRDNRMHIQGLDRRPQKHLAFLRQNPDHPKNGVL